MRIFLTLPRHDSCIEHTVQNLHLQCASLLETFISVTVSVDALPLHFQCKTLN